MGLRVSYDGYGGGSERPSADRTPARPPDWPKPRKPPGPRIEYERAEDCSCREAGPTGGASPPVAAERGEQEHGPRRGVRPHPPNQRYAEE
jgi:hypothetical protein